MRKWVPVPKSDGIRRKPAGNAHLDEVVYVLAVIAEGPLMWQVHTQSFKKAVY